jgi:hypothetical protein
MLAPSPHTIVDRGLRKFPWWLDWKDECVAIIGAGPSAKKAGVEALKDRIHVIAINESWNLCPWAEVLYSCDEGWWKLHDGVKQFAGLKVAHSPTAIQRYPDIKRVVVEPSCNDIKMAEPGELGAAGNSGFQAMNLALQFGVNGILLVGFDCHLDYGCHWHGRHPPPLTNPAQSNVNRWIKGFEGVASKLKMMGVQVINCSLDSALTAYPKMTIEGALARWRL